MAGICDNIPTVASVAQLDRASVFGTEGCRFESCRMRLSVLLAVDLGLRTGMAFYSQAGGLLRYRSRNFGSKARLRRGVAHILDENADLSLLVLEGGGPIADVWVRAAQRRAIAVRIISAETWRQRLLYPRLQRSGAQAKQSADELARRVIEWSQAPRPTALRHDAAEAILIGLWGVLDAGWLQRLPTQLEPR